MSEKKLGIAAHIYPSGLMINKPMNNNTENMKQYIETPISELPKVSEWYHTEIGVLYFALFNEKWYTHWYDDLDNKSAEPFEYWLKPIEQPTPPDLNQAAEDYLKQTGRLDFFEGIKDWLIQFALSQQQTPKSYEE